MTNMMTKIKEAIATTKSGQLLTTDNAKTIKGLKEGYSTAIIYLAPYTNFEGGENLCPNAILGECFKACLYSSGRGRFTSVIEGRMRKTAFYNQYKEEFKTKLVIEIAKFITTCTKNGVTPCIRLNGTSDIVWERQSVTIDRSVVEYVKKYYNIDLNIGYYENIMAIFPNIQFYDYTKISSRFMYVLPKNYDLTFSYSGVESYQKVVGLALQHNHRIAVVFRNEFPKTFLGKQVVHGDNTDLRFLESNDVVVGLYAKGSAKTDMSGFVQDVEVLV